MNTLFDQLLKYLSGFSPDYRSKAILRDARFGYIPNARPDSITVVLSVPDECRIVLRDDMTWDYAMDDEGYAKVLEDGLTMQQEKLDGHND
jgi:hypothetical protein